MGLDSGGDFAFHPGDASGGGAIDSFAPAPSASRLAHLCRSIPIDSIHQSSVDAADVDRSGKRDVLKRPKRPLLYHWISLQQIPEMFLKHLWLSEDQRFFQHEGFDWKEMDLAVKEAERKGP
jgi:membrane carboxypeptidase/penicillin-binding protein PbpC